MIIYLRCVIDINMFKFAFMVVFNYLWVDEIVKYNHERKLEHVYINNTT